MADAKEDVEKLRFVAAYQERKPQLERVLGQLAAFLEELRKAYYRDPVHRIHSVRSRIKEADSLWLKWTKKVRDPRNTDAFARQVRAKPPVTGDEILDKMIVRFSDLVGVRIVCNTIAGKRKVCEWLLERGPNAADPNQRLFTQLSGHDTYYKDSGYRSVHFDARIEPSRWPAIAIEPGDGDGEIGIEIQVRTILEEAWGEIQHDLMYKPFEGETPAETRKREAVTGPLFVALSHRLHGADLNVQRLTRRYQRKRVPAVQPSKPSTHQSIPTQIDDLPDSVSPYKETLRAHLVKVEGMRRQRDFEPACRLHTKLLKSLPNDAADTHIVVRAERALDQVRLAEARLSRGEDAADLLRLARADYDAALGRFAMDVVLLWRRAELRKLQDDRRGAIEDLTLAIKVSLDGAKRTNAEYFYNACLHRSLTPLIWAEGDDRKTTSPRVARKFYQQAAQHAETALHIQNAAVEREQRDGAVPSEACLLHYCDVLNNAAWLALVHHDDLDLADSYILRIERDVPSSLWEHDVFLLGTRLRLKIERLEKDDSEFRIERMVEADALAAQLMEALPEEQDEFVPPALIRSMLHTVSRLDALWQGFVLSTRGAATTAEPGKSTRTRRASTKRKRTRAS